MVVNRKWAWSLATPLHYEVYIGIDVLNRMAGLTFVYNHGQQIYFENYRSQQPERLTTRQLRDILLKSLREHLTELGLCPRSLVVHRHKLLPPVGEGLDHDGQVLVEVHAQLRRSPTQVLTVHRGGK